LRASSSSCKKPCEQLELEREKGEREGRERGRDVRGKK